MFLTWIYVCGRAVVEARVRPPRDGLVRRQATGPLPLEEEDRLRQRVAVIVAPAGSNMVGAEKEADDKHESRPR